MALFMPLVGWVDWGPYDGSRWYGLDAGHPGAHVFYLLGLCGLAGVAAWLRVTSRPRLTVAFGIAFLVLTIWGGMAQLP